VDEGALSRDDRWLVYHSGSGGGRDVYGVELGGDGTPLPLATGGFEEFSPTLSPDS
jgi:hypothetical protein